MASKRRTYTGSPGSAGWIESGTSIEVEESGNGDRQVVAVRNPNDGTVLDVSSFPLQVARGLITGVSSVNKFGKAPSGVQTTLTDIWSRANAAATQQIWLAPTAARIHTIVSSDALDTGFTVRIYGLKTWATAETTEDIALTGTTGVPTANSYVIIHRMKIIPTLAKPANVGTITATAAAPDSTVTAVILPGEGQTEMAIYGVPSTQDFYMTRWGCAMGKEVTAQSVNFTLRVNENPNVQTTGYVLKNDLGVLSVGASSIDKTFTNPIKYAGPCIIKVQGLASTADIDARAAFDGYLVTK